MSSRTTPAMTAVTSLRTAAFWAQIPAAGQREILAGFGAAIDAAGGGFTVQYATVAVTATRASTA